MITFVCWKWRCPSYRTTYTAEHVNVWAAMLKRHYSFPARLLCITDDPAGVDIETFPLWDDLGNLQNPNGYNLPSCYRRLKIFSGEQTGAMGIRADARVVSMDLDVVMVRDLTPLFDRPESFVGWRGVGSFRPVVYNGSLFMFRAGRMERLWKEFDPAKSPQRSKEARYFGSDQAWLSLMLDGKAPGWDTQDGVFSYSRDVRGRGLPDNARIVSFNGKWKPWDSQVTAEAPWVPKHWKADAVQGERRPSRVGADRAHG